MNGSIADEPLPGANGAPEQAAEQATAAEPSPEEMQAQLRELGIDMQLRTGPGSIIPQAHRDGTFQAGLGRLLKPGVPWLAIYKSSVRIVWPQARTIAVPTFESPL
mgnify:CR=1 FL=1